MSAAELAQTLTPHALQNDPSVVERAALDETPGYAETVDRIARERGDRLAGLRARRLAELRTEDPVAVRTLEPSWRTWLSLLGAYIAAVAGFALYFSRAQIDIVAIAPVALGLVLLAALLYALAALPMGRAMPPTSSVAVAGWILAVITAASTAYAAYAILRFSPEGVGWLVLGAVGVLVIIAIAVAAAVVRGSIPPDARAATEERVSGFRDGVRVDAERELGGAVDAVRAAYAAQSPQIRAALHDDLSAAAALLRERGVDYAAPAAPGEAVVRRELAVIATTIGVRDLGAAPAA